MDTLSSVFRGGHWVDEDLGRSLVGQKPNAGQGPENYEQTLYLTGSYLTVIGGQKYDEPLFDNYLKALDEEISFVVGGGRGAETWVTKNDHNVLKIDPDPDRYGKNARKVNVEQVLSFAPTSPLLLVGEGERVKQAKAWLKRANWGREVIELP